MVTSVRRRDIPVPITGVWYDRFADPPGSATIVTNHRETHQITTSEGHNWPSGKTSGRDIGGPFHTIRSWFDTDYEVQEWNLTGSYGQSYRGPIYPNWDGTQRGWINPGAITASQLALGHRIGPMTQAQMIAAGTKAIANTLPTNPPLDGAVSLAELFREGIPSMIGGALLKSRMRSAKEYGSEYLNYQFGWMPLVSDLKSAAKTIIDSEKLLLQLQRDSGRNVRRRFAFPEESYNLLSSTSTTPWPNPAGGLFVSCPTHTWHRSVSKTWFSGAYTYHYDPGDLSEVSRIATQARLLYGIKLDPDVLWNLAPWSWLTDWVFNTGDILRNMSAFGQDELVLRYGYLMNNVRDTRKMTHAFAKTHTGQRPYGHPISGTAYLETKQRIRATPYGFGSLLSSFTGGQWAILGALGISRLPGGKIL